MRKERAVNLGFLRPDHRAVLCGSKTKLCAAATFKTQPIKTTAEHINSLEESKNWVNGPVGDKCVDVDAPQHSNKLLM